MESIYRMEALMPGAYARFTDPKVLLKGLSNPKSSGHWLYAFITDSNFFEYMTEGFGALIMLSFVFWGGLSIFSSYEMWNTGYTVNYWLDFGDNLCGKMIGDDNTKWLLDVTYFTYYEQLVRVIDLWVNQYFWDTIFGSKQQ